MDWDIRTTTKDDLPAIINLLNDLPLKERKYLALDQKLSLIRKEIRSGRHTFVVVIDNEFVVGFARESGRENKFVLLEEIAVHPDFRKQGIASFLLKWLLDRYPKVMAKTLADNLSIAALLDKHDFKVAKTSPKGEILYWEHV